MAPGAEAPWQMPQGGIDAGEAPRDAVFRELREEIGTDKAEILAEHPDWLTYDLPAEYRGTAFRGRFRGQTQKWFALRFTGTDADIALDRHEPAEFSTWRWARLADLPALVVPFKRPVYDVLARDFSRFAGD